MTRLLGSPARRGYDLRSRQRQPMVTGTAPLAQSAEHSHGKAGVVGSIPTGGSAAA